MTAVGSGTAVEFRGIRRSFGATHALDGLDLLLKPGELLALLGPSGCGKTTALRLLAGFDSPTDGQVLIGGKDVTGVPAAKRDTGMVFQAYALFPNMTVRGNVAFGLKIAGQGKPAIAARVAEMLALVGLVLRPLLLALCVAVGGAGVLVIGLFSQVAVVYVALRLDPGVRLRGVAPAVGVAWLLAGVGALIGWLDDRGERFSDVEDQRDLVGRVRFGHALIEQVQKTDHAIVADQRHTDARLHLNERGAHVVQALQLFARLLTFDELAGA